MKERVGGWMVNSHCVHMCTRYLTHVLRCRSILVGLPHAGMNIPKTGMPGQNTRLWGSVSLLTLSVDCESLVSVHLNLKALSMKLLCSFLRRNSWKFSPAFLTHLSWAPFGGLYTKGEREKDGESHNTVRYLLYSCLFRETPFSTFSRAFVC